MGIIVTTIITIIVVEIYFKTTMIWLKPSNLKPNILSDDPSTSTFPLKHQQCCGDFLTLGHFPRKLRRPGWVNWCQTQGRPFLSSSIYNAGWIVISYKYVLRYFFIKKKHLSYRVKIQTVNTYGRSLWSQPFEFDTYGGDPNNHQNLHAAL